MDPYSRRSTWELLRNAKKDRVIVLTTHFSEWGLCERAEPSCYACVIEPSPRPAPVGRSVAVRSFLSVWQSGC